MESWLYFQDSENFKSQRKGFVTMASLTMTEVIIHTCYNWIKRLSSLEAYLHLDLKTGLLLLVPPNVLMIQVIMQLSGRASLLY